MSLSKLDWKMMGLVVVAVILRLALTPTIFHGDMVAQGEWGKWIFENGAKGFYENRNWTYVWPNQPPLINLVYSWGFSTYATINTGLILLGSFIANNHLGAAHMPWLYTFIVWWGNNRLTDTWLKTGGLISMKLWPIVGDLVLAYMIFKIVKVMVDLKAAKWAMMIYLFSPFTWYESGVWGQHDQLGLIFLLLAFYMAVSGRYAVWAPVAMMTSILLKPTAFIFGPLLLWVVVKDKKTFIKTVVGSGLALVGYYGLAKLFSDKNLIDFSLSLQKQMFVKGEMMTWVNTFNIWRVVTGYLTDYRQLFLGINLKIWGYLMFLVINIIGFKLSRKRDWMGVLKGIFVVGFGGWMTMVTMHERYLFTAVVVGIILASKDGRLWKYWWIMSGIFWVNMYNGWWTPKFMDWLKYILTFDNQMDGMVPKTLAMINVWLMVKMFGIVMRNNK